MGGVEISKSDVKTFLKWLTSDVDSNIVECSY